MPAAGQQQAHLPNRVCCRADNKTKRGKYACSEKERIFYFIRFCAFVTCNTFLPISIACTYLSGVPALITVERRVILSAAGTSTKVHTPQLHLFTPSQSRRMVPQSPSTLVRHVLSVCGAVLSDLHQFVLIPSHL